MVYVCACVSAVYVGTRPEERHYIGLLGFFANARFLIRDAALPTSRSFSVRYYYYYYIIVLYCSTAILLVSYILLLCTCVFSTRNRIRDKVSVIIRHLQPYSLQLFTRLGPGRDVNICLLFYRSDVILHNIIFYTHV